MENCPDGVLSSTEIPPTNKSMQFYTRKEDDKYRYIACLSRNLSSGEANKIAKKFASKEDNGNFSIFWSQDLTPDPKYTQLSEDLLKAITLEAARMNHNRWVQTRINEGWRFGTTHSNKQRISPICQNWDNLPESYKRAEYQRIKTLLEVLNSMNLKLVRR